MCNLNFSFRVLDQASQISFIIFAIVLRTVQSLGSVFFFFALYEELVVQLPSISEQSIIVRSFNWIQILHL